jgi:hypothetical protein
MGTQPTTAPRGGSIMVNLFDGTRRQVPDGTDVLITVKDGNQNIVKREDYTHPSVFFQGLQVFGNFGDDYTVVASAKNCGDTGFFPVHIAENVVQIVDLMLLPKDGGFNFNAASWKKLKQARPVLAAILAEGVTAGAAQQRYGDLQERESGAVLACLLNIATAMEQIFLPVGNALQYLKTLVWDQLASDRFFAYADPALVDQVKTATVHGTFAPAPYNLHPGATSSYKQIQFGEANVQLTFHENDTKVVGGQNCVLVEPDVDYFKDLGAHLILEVVTNAFGGVTDPRVVYMLRWIAGRRAGVAEFDPLYVIV